LGTLAHPYQIPEERAGASRIFAALIERPDNNRVEDMMTRARVILASLLPTLWLIASMDCWGCAVGGLAGVRPDSTLSEAGHGKHDCSTSFCSLEQSARRWSRRLHFQSGAEEFSSPALLPPFQSPIPAQLIDFSRRANLSSGLANCWQFRCRTALEPRAPSTVS